MYRNGENGPSAKSMAMEEPWKDRLIDETTVYDSEFQVG
jgi:hypothetical protein